MDLQTVLKGMMAQHAQERFAASEQLSLGELTLKLEAVTDKEKPVVFDFGGYAPSGLTSWRGSYSELSITFEGSSDCYENYVDWNNEGTAYSTCMDKPSVKELLEVLRRATGKTFIGYKGGKFVMGRQTPVWVANYGSSGMKGYKNLPEYTSIAVIDVEESPDAVTLITKAEEY